MGINIKSLLFENRGLKQTIAKNTFWISLSEGMGKFLRAILIIYVARILGAGEYGKFTFALAFVSLFVSLFDFGLSGIVTREFSRRKEKERIFSSIISLKILLGIVSIFLIFALSFFITQSFEIRKIIWILSFFVFVSQFPEIFYAFLRAREKMQYESLGNILQVLLVVGIIFFVIFNFPSIKNISYGYLFAALISSVIFLAFFHFRIFPLKLSFKTEVWREFLLLSWPLGLVSILGMLYSYIDSIMMGSWNLVIETGWYNAALKIINIVLAPASVISLVFFPTISRFVAESKERVQKVWNYQLKISLFLIIPMIVGGMALSFKIIVFIYDLDFLPSVLALKILLVMAGIAFLCAIFSQMLIALGCQKKVFLIAFVGGLVNIILNLILIPRYSLYGAAATSAGTYFFMLVIYLYFISKSDFIKPINLKIFVDFVKIIIAVVGMYLIISIPKINNLHILYIVFIGFLVYTSLFFLIEIAWKKIIKIALFNNV